MKKFKIILTLIVLSAIGILALLVMGNYSDGFRAGTMVKLSKKGYVLKTYEGQLNLGMVLSENQPGVTGAAVSNIWEFSVHSKDKEVVETLEKAILEGERVKLHYEEKFFHYFWMGDTKYFVYKVEVLKREEK